MANQNKQYDIVLKNGRVIDPETYLDGIYNVGIIGGQIATITKDKLDGKDIVDASNLLVSPGFIDLHTHAQNISSNRMQAFDGLTTALEKEYRQYILQLTCRRATIAVGGHWKDGIAKTQLVFIAKKDMVNFMVLEKALNDCKAFAESEHKCC